MIVQFWRHTIAKRQGGDNAEETWRSWLCFDISQGRTFCLHSGIGLDFNWVGLTRTPARVSVCFVHYIRFTITLFSAYLSSISCLEPSTVD